MTNPKIQGEVSLDTSSADAAFARVETNAAKMAAGVQASAEKAGKAVPAIGAGGDQAAQKIDRATKSIIDSVQRTTAAMQAGEKGSAKYYESLATQRGANVDALRPYLAQLEQAKRAQDIASGSLNGMAMSAKQTTAALRQVPAQFTDIVTSLQGGQAPLTVLLQQGGQLKDVFGGVGPAARALGGYVSGLINPFTLAAAAVGGLAFAYYKGSQEGDAYAKALILTGNAAGSTVGQLSEMAKRIGEVAGTQGNAAEALAIFAGNAKVGAANMEAFTQAAIRFERITGQAVGDTAKQFADLAKDPLTASLKLNEGMNYLTTSTYQQIKALEDQGRATEAANLAQKAFADTLEARSGDMEKRLGAIERAWRGIKDAASGALSAINDVGRPDTAQDELRRVRNMIATKQGSTSTGRAAGIVSAELASLQEQERILTGRIAAESRLAGEQQRSAAQVKARAEADKDGAKYLSDQVKLQAELTRQTATLRAAGASGSEIAAREKAIRDEFAKKERKDPAIKQAETALEKYRNLVGDLAGEQSGLSSSFNDQAATLQKGWKLSGDSVEVYNRALEQLKARQPGAVKAARDQLEIEQAVAKFRLEGFKAIESQYAKEAAAAEQSAKAVQDRVTALRDEEEAIQRAQLLNIGLAAALEQVRVARLEAELKDAQGTANQQRVDALEKELALRRELVGLSDRKSSRDTANEDLKKFMKPDFSTDFSAGFDKSSQAAGTFVQTMAKLIDAQERYNDVRANAKASSADLAKAEVGFQRQQISGYASLAGAAKGFFNEKSTGYKVLLAAEQGLRAAELAGSIASITSTFAEGQAKAVSGVVNQASGDPYSAFPRMAAMAAIMAGLGFIVGGIGGGGSSAPAVPLNTGTGTVFGDSEAQSKSISNSIDLLKDVDTITMRYSGQMLESLRNIENSLAGVTGQILRNGGKLTGSDFESIKTQNGQGVIDFINNSVIKQLGSGTVGGAITGALLRGLLGSTKTTLADAGLQFFGKSLGDVLSGGVAAQSFQSTETTTKKLFGLSKSTSYNTSFGGLDTNLTNQFTNLIRDTYDSVIAANKALGFSADETAAKIKGFTVDLGRVSLKGLSGEQIQERLTAVFGAFADNLATASASQYLEFQKAGEGYFETLVRVASGFEEASALLDRLGVTSIALADVNRKQGDAAAELVRQSLQAKEGLTGISEVLAIIDDTAAEIVDAYKSLTGARTDLNLFGLNGSAVGVSLLQGAGGIQALTDSLKAFEDGFVSDTDKVTNQAERMSIQFKLLGLALPSSGDAFVSLIKGIDTSTDAGKKLLGSVLGLSGGFSDLLSAIQDVGSGIADEIERIKALGNSSSAKSAAQLQTEFAIKTAQARAGDQSAIDLLPSISQALLKAAEATAGSSLDVAVIQARTLASLQATLDAISDPTKRLGTLPGFASGGYFSGGYRIVGESGPELEATGPSRIFDASQTARILGGGAGNAELLAEVRALRLELTALKETQSNEALAQAMIMNRVANVVERVNQDGDALTVRVAA